jgi:hypothetical protein
MSAENIRPELDFVGSVVLTVMSPYSASSPISDQLLPPIM